MLSTSHPYGRIKLGRFASHSLLHVDLADSVGNDHAGLVTSDRLERHNSGPVDILCHQGATQTSTPRLLAAVAFFTCAATSQQHMHRRDEQRSTKFS